MQKFLILLRFKSVISTENKSAKMLFHLIFTAKYIFVFRVKRPRFKPFVTRAEVDIHRFFSKRFDIFFGGIQKRRSYSLPFEIAFDEKSVKRNIFALFVNIEADTADNSVILVKRKPKRAALPEIILFDIQQIGIEPWHSAEGVFRFKYHKKHIVTILVFKFYDFHISPYQALKSYNSAVSALRYSCFS